MLCMIFNVVYVVHAKSTDNIIIDNVKESYLMMPSKDGSSIEKIKANKELVYTAQRVDEKAIAMQYYNSFVSIDKASAPDTKPVYFSATDEGIFYDDSKVCGLNFNVKKGKNATVKFEQTYLAPEYFTVISLSEVYYVKNKTVTITVPQAFANKIKVVEKSFTPNITSHRSVGKKGETIYSFTVTDLDCFKREDSAPHIGTVVPRVYICGSFANVNELYGYLHQYTTDADAGIESVNTIAKDIVSACESDDERIAKLTHWVHKNIRYIAVEHGEYGQRPELASEVLRKRYGDCKGMSSLLKAMLCAVGIDARLTWIGTDAIAHDWEEIPSIASGNHMICSVVNGDSILYIDGTASYLPIGCYSPSIQGQQTIIENGDSCILHRVPVQLPEVNSDKLAGKMHINGNNLEGSLSNTLTGTARMVFCSSIYATDAAKRDDFVETYMSYPRQNAKISNLNIEGDSISDNVTTISTDIIEPDACQHLGDVIYVELLPFRTGIIDTYDLKERCRDIKLPYRRCLVSDFSVAIPEGFSVAYLPDGCDIDNDWFKCTIKYTSDAGEVKCHGELTIKNTHVAVDDAPEWNKIARQFKQANTEQITLKQN